jgi:hypothetical protein
LKWSGQIGNDRIESNVSAAEKEEIIVASVRAEGVAEALFELKRLDKLATFTQVATRAGFKPGAGGRTLMTCLLAVQRDWPHLHWWRAIPDDGLLLKESEHAKMLSSGGFEVSAAEGKKDMVTVVTLEEALFKWEPQVVG